MQVMGTNRWAYDADPKMLLQGALAFADDVKERGIAELHGAWLAEDDKLMWCAWDTDDLDALQAAFDDPASTEAYVKEHAQELADEVTGEHIKTYVNDFTLNLGDEGRAAIDTLEKMAQAAGVFQ